MTISRRPAPSECRLLGGRLAALALGGAVLAAGLAGCGFQLRSFSLSSAFQTARIEADASVDFARQLGQTLRRAGVVVVEDEADVVLKLTRQEQERRTASVAADARVAEYALALKVLFAGEDERGAVLLSPRVLHVERIARLRRDHLLGSSDEEALLGAEMRAELCGRIARALGAAAAAKRRDAGG